MHGTQKFAPSLKPPKRQTFALLGLFRHDWLLLISSWWTGPGIVDQFFSDSDEEASKTSFIELRNCSLSTLTCC